MLVRHSRKKFNYLSFGKAAGKQKKAYFAYEFCFSRKTWKILGKLRWFDFYHLSQTFHKLGSESRQKGKEGHK